MAEINLKKDAVSAETDRVKAEAEQMCPACEHMLWVSFYFDGFGFGEKDGPRTNILKLFNAAADGRHVEHAAARAGPSTGRGRAAVACQCGCAVVHLEVTRGPGCL
jgi:hypothetical protein